ncbi:deoxyribonuclease IV [bacterium]|nr:deoxyribonuclease IV [bacterium]
MLKIGCHLSSAGGYMAMLGDAVSIKASTFQFFTRNPRGGSAKARDLEDERKFVSEREGAGIEAILAHAPYTLNPCSADANVRDFALRVMTDDMERLEGVPGSLYVFHPGSHVGQGIEKGIELIAEFLNKILKPEQSTFVMLETMAGKGSEVGSRFEELRAIIDRAEVKEKLGVCLDTCHVSDAGYDIIGDLDGVLKQFDSVIGLERLRAIHINDSKNPPGSHKDRHAPIGEGTLGMKTFESVVNHPALRDLPFFLETPNELIGYAKEIALLRTLAK